MLYKNICGFNLNLIRATLVIGAYDIFGTLTMIILNIEFFRESETFFCTVKGQLIMILFYFFSACTAINLHLMLFNWFNGSNFINSWCFENESFFAHLLDGYGYFKNDYTNFAYYRDFLLSNPRLCALWNFLHHSRNFRLRFVDHKKSFFLSSYCSLFHFLFSLILVVLIASFCLVVSLYRQLKNRDQNNFTRLENDVWW